MAQAKKDLTAARLVRKNRKEYALLVGMIDDLPSRAETTRFLFTLLRFPFFFNKIVILIPAVFKLIVLEHLFSKEIGRYARRACTAAGTSAAVGSEGKMLPYMLTEQVL